MTLVPNAEIYDELREFILILSQKEVLYLNKSIKSYLGALTSEVQESLVVNIVRLRGGEDSERDFLKGLPFEEVMIRTIKLTDGSEADLILLNTSKQITIDAEYFHYKLLLTAEEELGFGCWNNNLKDDIIFWSDGMARIFGYKDASEVKGQNNWEGFVAHVSREYKDAVNRRIQEKISNGIDGESKQTELRIVKIDGTKRLVSLKTHYIERGDDGEVLSLYGTIKDITDIRNKEKIIKQQLAELNKSNDALTQFAYTASHDLQEPLRKIEAYGNRLKNSLGEDLPENSERYLGKLISSTLRMSNLIEDILTLSRLNAINVKAEKVNLNEVIGGILADYEESIKETEAEITFDLPTILGLKSQFHQLFQNLIGNAIKFKHPERVPKIDISFTKIKKKEKQSLKLDPDKKYYCIKVADNGIGFDQKFETSIYTPFKRLVGRTEFSGTGIGLAISKKVVDNHDGFIRAESQEGEGTSFYLYFPI
ncbi:ATP-binding protein [uncultured Arcticibacterium sp.]|uniref:sensor histidine kinase n=1 Tax=uncultured Arcticibacterium sp. TaxID=2173042 RepID=UPI0030F93994